MYDHKVSICAFILKFLPVLVFKICFNMQPIHRAVASNMWNLKPLKHFKLKGSIFFNTFSASKCCSNFILSFSENSVASEDTKYDRITILGKIFIK